MTNATKAGVITCLNALLGLLLAFGVPLSTVQTGAILAFGNAVLGLVVALTYKQSAKRIPGS